MATTINGKTATPQLSQLEIMFKGPLWVDMQVGKVEDLQSIKQLYINKLVWVNDEQTWYYYYGMETNVVEGITTNVHRWEKQSSRSTITVYDKEKEYLEGDAVFCDGKIYSALMSIKKYETPLLPYIPPKWLCIAGNTITRTFIFSNVSAVVISTDIENPMFYTYIKDKVTNIEHLATVSFEKLSEKEYRFEFYENGVLTPQSGSIVHK